MLQQTVKSVISFCNCYSKRMDIQAGLVEEQYCLGKLVCYGKTVTLAIIICNIP